MKYINELAGRYKPLVTLPQDVDINKQEVRYVEIGLYFCQHFLPHEPPDTELLPQLLSNHDSLVDWGQQEGERLLPTLLRLLPRMGATHWQGLLKRYQTLPQSERLYRIDGNQFIPVDYPSVERLAVLAETFKQPLFRQPYAAKWLPSSNSDDFVEHVTVKAVREGIPVQTQYPIAKWLLNKAEQTQAKAKEPKPRKLKNGCQQPITIDYQALLTVSEAIDAKDRKRNNGKDHQLAKRFTNLNQSQVIRHSTKDGASQLSISASDQLTIDRFCHLIGKPSSGKSTLMQVLLVYLAQNGYRVAVICDATRTAYQQQQRYQQLEIDTAVWCSPSRRGEYARREYMADEQRIAIKTDMPDVGMLASGCLLRSQSQQPLLNQSGRHFVPPGPQDGICERLINTENPRLTYACTLSAICPQFAQERALQQASVIFISDIAWAKMRPSPLFFPHYQSVCDFLTHEVDVVLIDEADAVQRNLDQQFTVEAELYGRNNWPSIIVEELTRVTRQRSDGGRNHSIETCKNLATQLESYSRYMGNLLRRLHESPIGKKTLAFPFNELSLLASLMARLRYTERVSLDASEETAHRQVLNGLSEMLEISSATYDRGQRQPRSHEDPLVSAKKWLIEQYGHTSVENQALAWAFYRLLNFITRSLNTDTRPENVAYEYCKELWQEAYNPGKLEGGFAMLFQHIQRLVPNGKSDEDVKYKLRMRQADAQLVITCTAFSRMILRVFARIGYPAQVLAEDNLITSNNLRDVARMERMHKTQVPGTLLKDANVLAFEQDSDESCWLTYKRQLGAGRSLIHRLPLARQAEGQFGPHVFLMSGTSYAGNGLKLPDAENEQDAASPIYDIPLDVNYVLEQPEIEQQAIANQSIFTPHICRDEQGQPLQVSGSPLDDRDNIATEIARQILQRPDPHSKSQAELDFEKAEDKWGSDYIDSRRRVLLVVSSYAMAKAVFEQLSTILDDHWRLVAIRPNDFELTAKPSLPTHCQWLCSGDIERFGESEEYSVLIAPLSVISRGHNILAESPTLNKKVAAIGFIYFLTRPLPHPGDQSALIGFHNRALVAIQDSTYWQLAEDGEGTLALGRRMRKKLNQRYRQAQIDNRVYSAMNEETRLRFLYQPLTMIWQTLCRGVRGGVPVFVAFVDSAFHRKAGKGETDDEKTSMLIGIEDLLSKLCDKSLNHNHPLARHMYDAPAEAFAGLSERLAQLAREIAEEQSDHDHWDEDEQEQEQEQEQDTE